MSETNKKFSPEQIRAFEDKYNIGVNNREAMVELFMRQQAQIDEIAKNITVQIGVYGTNMMGVDTLYNSWNNK